MTTTNAPEVEQFAISGLNINPQTRINQLTYSQEQQLSFCLQSAIQASEYCLFPENADNFSNSSSSESLGNLKLLLAQQAYILNLEQINIPQLNVASDNNSYQGIELKYTPQTQEPQLDILSPTTIRIDLPIIN